MAGSGLTQLAFQPQHAALGGTILGAATVGFLLLNGRVLGISGAIKGLVSGDRQAWRLAFLAGMVSSAPVMAPLLPGAFEAVPATVSLTRTLLGGLLVGLGASLGNGCTSGHGICGNARLSVRSALYTLTFMAAGMASAQAFQSATALGVAPVPPPFVPLSPTESQLGLSLLGGGVAAMAAVGAAWRAAGDGVPALRSAFQLLSSTLVGALFGCGLVLSGMVRPAKVVGFLSIAHAGWDPSLMFVMAAAIGVSIVAFQLVLGRLVATPPALKVPVLSSAYTLPSAAAGVDAQLLLGGVLFGAGWGLTGMCPGPAIVAAASPAGGPQIWGYLAGMLGGMVVEPAVRGSLFGAPAAKAAH